MSTAVAKTQETTITFIPLGESEQIHLTLSRVKQFLCVPTKSGKYPTDEQVVKFMMLCKAQSLNPWVNDAYLVGYDSKDGPSFSLITAHQAFLKRAEASPEFDGMESGVTVLANGSVLERPGDLVLEGETLVGGWARVHRRDRRVSSYDSLSRRTFDTGRSRWAVDPAGMIVKCAEASALRKAFPSSLAALYCKEEMDKAITTSATRSDGSAAANEVLASIASRVTASESPKLPEQSTQAGAAQDAPEATPPTLADIAAATDRETLDAMNAALTAAFNAKAITPDDAECRLAAISKRWSEVAK